MAKTHTQKKISSITSFTEFLQFPLLPPHNLTVATISATIGISGKTDGQAQKTDG